MPPAPSTPSTSANTNSPGGRLCGLPAHPKGEGLCLVHFRHLHAKPKPREDDLSRSPAFPFRIHAQPSHLCSLRTSALSASLRCSFFGAGMYSARTSLSSLHLLAFHKFPSRTPKTPGWAPPLYAGSPFSWWCPLWLPGNLFFFPLPLATRLRPPRPSGCKLSANSYKLSKLPDRCSPIADRFVLSPPVTPHSPLTSSHLPSNLSPHPCDPCTPKRPFSGVSLDLLRVLWHARGPV